MDVAGFSQANRKIRAGAKCEEVLGLLYLQTQQTRALLVVGSVVHTGEESLEGITEECCCRELYAEGGALLKEELC